MLSALLPFLLAACPPLVPQQSGTLTAGALNEVSGLAASRRNPGIFWVHNDSGDTARFFAITAAGTLRGTYNLSGITATDWEDIACGPGPDAKTYLYFADTGDNNRDRTDLRIVRVEEPAASLSGAVATVTLSGAVTFPVSYQGGARYDAETLLLDPLSRRLYLITRDRANEGFARLLEASIPGAFPQPVVFIQGGTLSSPPGTLFKGGDVSASGQAIALLAHSNNTREVHLLLRSRIGTEALATALGRAACDGLLTPMDQAEALGFSADGLRVMVTGEGSDQPILGVTLPTPTEERWTFF